MITFAGMLLAVSTAFTYGTREAHPAVVNPALGEDGNRVISLRGEWDFATSDVYSRMNSFEIHMSRPDAGWRRKIEVPAVWEAQGVGEPGMSWCWDVLGDNNAKMIRSKFVGWGRYRKTVDIPAEWKGRRIWLKIGGVKSKGWFYVNGTPVAMVDNYCGTEKYEITDLVRFGEENSVAAQVSNQIPSRKGLMSAMHRWGGIYRDVEIEATPDTLIDDAWVRGDFDGRAAEVHVDILGETNGHAIRVRIGDDVVEVSAKEGENIVRVPLSDFRPWSPENPNLYVAEIELVENDVSMQLRKERFGIRKLEVVGKEFRLNGKPFYMRGFGDDHVYPLTGISPADISIHRAHLARARAAGFNFVRLHTHCELPEYFEAADELGILIQPELPYYNDQTCEGFEFDPRRDAEELWRNYRRHPSFAVYCMGNEGTFGKELDAALHRYIKAMDPDRLKINQDSHLPQFNPPESADYLGGPLDVWERGSYDPDRPFLTHEYMNLCVKLDSALEDRFTGAWLPPVTRTARADWLARFGLDMTWGDRLQFAQHRLQAYYQKLGIETARHDPYCDGHIFWTIVDVVVEQGATYTAQGVFNPFWETKRGGFSPEDIAMFNSPACVLADFEPSSSIAVVGDEIRARVKFVDYRDEPLAADRIRWCLRAEDCDLAGGVIPPSIGGFDIEVPDAVRRPVAAQLWIEAGGVSNRWDFWLFPKRGKRTLEGVAVADELMPAFGRLYDGLMPDTEAADAKVVIAPAGNALVREALERGQRVIAIGRANGEPNVSLGWWFMGRQVGTALADSPVFGSLPHSEYLDKLLFRLVKVGRKLPIEGLSTKDMFMVGEGGVDCFLYLGQARSAKGRLIMSYGLDLLNDTPEAAVLLDGMIDYAAGDGFEPEGEIAVPSTPVYSGWKTTIRAADSYDSYLPKEFGALSMARGEENANELTWCSTEIPADVGEKPTFDLVFPGGMGYRSEPSVSATLYLDGKMAVELPDYSWEDIVWTTGDCSLKYKRDAATDEFGLFTLTVPSEWLTPGRKVELKVVVQPANGGSRRWFGILEP